MTEQNPFEPQRPAEAQPPVAQFGSPTPTPTPASAPSYPPASIASPYGTPPRPVGVAQQEQPGSPQPAGPAPMAPTYGSSDSHPGGLSPLPGTGIPIPEPTPRKHRNPAGMYLLLLWILGTVVTVLGLILVLTGLAQLADGSGAGRAVLLGQPLLTAGPVMLAIALAIQAYTAIAKRR